MPKRLLKNLQVQKGEKMSKPKMAVIGVRKGGVWFYKIDPNFGKVTLEPKVMSSFVYNLFASPDISQAFKKVLYEEVIK